MLGSGIVDHLLKLKYPFDLLDRSAISYDDDSKNISLLNDYDVIIHAAANTNAEECEKNPKDCFRDNTLLTEKLAYASSKAGCTFVFISSTGVYGKYEESRPYTEHDIARPTTVHHKSKLLAESAVTKWCKSYLIIRTGWLFGGSPKNAKNFVARRIEEALNEGEFIESNIQQLGCPTWSEDVAMTIIKLVESLQVGIFNVVNQGSATRFDYVRHILASAGISKDVRPVNADSFKRLADVSNNESAECLKLSQIGFDLLPPWQLSLDKYIKQDLSAWLSSKSSS